MNSQINLIVTGKVENFVTVTPKRVNLMGSIQDEIKASVSIVPESKYPFKIIEFKTAQGENIKLDINEVKRENNPSEYLLTVYNLKKDKGRYFDTIILKTDNAIKPEISISVYGNITDPSQPKVQ